MDINQKLLWKIAHKLCNTNFTELNLPLYKQSDIKNINIRNPDRGYCGLVSILSSFGNYFNLSKEKISRMTKLDISVRNNPELIVKYFNQINPKSKYELIFKNNIQLFKIINIIHDNINEGISCVLTFNDTGFNIGHAISIYKEDEDTIGFIENGNEQVTLFFIALAYIVVEKPTEIFKDFDYDTLKLKKFIDSCLNNETNFQKLKLDYIPSVYSKVCKIEDNVKITVNKKSLVYLENRGIIYIQDKHNKSIYDKITDRQENIFRNFNIELS